MTGPRIVSLLASGTEIVCGLGFESQLVGRSHECDYPESVRKLPACTEPKFDIRLSSYEIDARVKGIVQEALSVYRVDAEKLRGLQPDVIVTQSQCEVCAVSLRDVEEALEAWLPSRPRLVSLTAVDLAGLWADIQNVARSLEASGRGRQLAQRLRERLAGIERRARVLPHRPTVACIEWIEPLLAAGNWMPELVAMAGGTNLFGEAGHHSPKLSWEELRAADPEVIFVAPCGFDLARTRDEMPALVRQPGWEGLRAVREGRVVLADGNAYFNRSGPRLVESLEILAEVLHPRDLDFGHRACWQNLE